MDIITLLTETELAGSRSEARRLIQQGGIYLEEERVEDVDKIVSEEVFKNNELVIRKAKSLSQNYLGIKGHASVSFYLTNILLRK